MCELDGCGCVWENNFVGDEEKNTHILERK